MSGFLQRTFQLSKGVGPWRERDLWARELETWDDFERAAASGAVMSSRLDAETLDQIARLRGALAAGDLPTIAKAVARREHWRIYPHFTRQAAFFDIEADGENVPTVVGVLDGQGVATFRRGHSLEQLPERLAASPIWVTFNGGAFDIPALEAHFETFPEPLVHVDLRFLVRKARLKGGLKAVEDGLGMHRPPHLKGLRGFDAIRLWREFNASQSLTALRILVEYNLYDAINLRPVLEWTMWKLAEQYAWRLEKRPIFERGDVLYDVSRLVLAQP